MTVSFVDWITTFALNRSGNAYIDWLTKSALIDLLSNDIASWATELPTHLALNPIAMFPKSLEKEPEENRPALAKLKNSFIAYQVPNEATWFDALNEQWEAIRSRNPGASAFFKAKSSEVNPLLRELATKLARRCSLDEQLFRGTVIETLRKLVNGKVPEESVAEGLITFLEDRNVLHETLNNETPLGCYESAKIMRATLNETMKYVSKTSTLYLQCDKIRISSTKLMREIERLGLNQDRQYYTIESTTRTSFHEAILKFRKSCANPTKQICDTYNIPPNDQLRSLFEY